MKILNILVSGRPGGIESLCNSLDIYSKEDNYWYFIFDGGKIADVIKNRHPENTYINHYTKNDFNVVLEEIKSLIKQKEIDTINIHHGSLFCNILICKIYKANLGVNIVRTLHSCYEKTKTLKDRIYDHYMKKALNISNLVVCVSYAVQKTFQKKFPKEMQKSIVIYNGIPKEYLKDDVKISKKDFDNILYVGRLEKEKGVSLLIEAFSMLKHDELIKNNIHLTIVGDGKQRDELEELAKSKRVNKYISFEGSKTNPIEYYNNSGIFVYPSICDEAFGISIVEAMSRGCATVAFNKGGIPEIINNQKDGFLVFDTNSESLYRSIKAIYALDITQKEEIVSNAIETAKKYSIVNTAEKLDSCYYKINNK